ncbi:hypothetical protein OHA01_18750 [Micromonospora zamorensis]|uniref:hypothetical protein n=1 Tax=Micromonospora zamorensis TaxID=709883 RepID=UPI00081FF8D2|nr:hypothetical protein [Micromonospora zamorensis]WTE84662.1 hypothetical protein OHA01_18750 [Micromonospora zamorensis]SCG35496.1 hypothetical protein GA0070619_0205 [Micromonospora zamorensis]
MARPGTENTKPNLWAWPVGIMIGLAVGIPVFGSKGGVAFGVALGVVFAVTFGATRRRTGGDPVGGAAGREVSSTDAGQGNISTDDATVAHADGSRRG